MKVHVNNKEVECQGTHLSELITTLNLPQRGIAVAVDNQMISVTQWSSFELKEGMNILIIKAVCGG